MPTPEEKDSFQEAMKYIDKLIDDLFNSGINNHLQQKYQNDIVGISAILTLNLRELKSADITDEDKNLIISDTIEHTQSLIKFLSDLSLECPSDFKSLCENAKTNLELFLKSDFMKIESENDEKSHIEENSNHRAPGMRF